MKPKLLVISQMQIWDLKKNAGKAVMDKTFTEFGKCYDLMIIAPGDEVSYNSSKFFKLTSTLEEKVGNISIVGHFFRYFSMYFFYLEVNKIIKVNNLNPDIVYLVGYFAAFTGHKIFGKNKFSINRYYGVAWNEDTFNHFGQKIKFILRKYCFRKFANMIIMTNDGTKGELFFKKIGYKGNKFYFLKNGIEDKFSLKTDFKQDFILKHNLSKDTLFMLTVSRLAGWKKVDRAIEALSHLVQKHPNLILVVVGNGEMFNNLVELTKSLNLEKHVIFEGSISHDELPNYYQLTDLFISLYDYSNAGNPLFEAMLHKRAIVTINNGDTLDFINHDAAKIIDDFDPNQLTEAISKLIDNPALRLEKGENAHQLLRKNFKNWDERIQQEIELINDNYISFLEENRC